MRRIRSLALYLLVIVASLVFAWPLLWLASNSLKDEDEVFGPSSLDMVPALPSPKASGPWADPATGETRALLLGPVRLLLKDGRELEPGAGAPISRRVHVEGPAAVSLTDVRVQEAMDYVQVRYDFATGDSFAVVVAIDSAGGPEANSFEAVQLDYQPDDSWNFLGCEVLLPGDRRYRAARPIPLSGRRRQSTQWRIPSGDEDLTRLRSWVTLKPSPSQGPSHGTRVTFTIRRADTTSAAWAKIRRNYDRVLDSIPVWQYARVSVVLALLNVILTVSSSAVVAYAFARLEWPGRDACFALLLCTM